MEHNRPKTPKFIYDFVVESNAIEGITREPTEAEVTAHTDFYELPLVTVPQIAKFVSICQPGAVLRDRRGLDVRVGSHLPPFGGPSIKTKLQELVDDVNSPHLDIIKDAYEVHQRYETLHPFTDGNGRSGRVIWLHMMRDQGLPFLHRWYYQSLQNYR
jgi:hypothetical protein